MLCTNSGRVEAHNVAKSIHTTLATPISWLPADPQPTATDRPVSVTLTAAIGIAATTDPTTTAHQLLHAADTDMYQAKHHR